MMTHMSDEEFQKFAEQIDDLHKGLWQIAERHYKDRIESGESFLLSQKRFLEVAVEAFNFAQPHFRNLYEQKYKKEYDEKLKEMQIAFESAKKALMDTIEMLSRK